MPLILGNKCVRTPAPEFIEAEICTIFLVPVAGMDLFQASCACAPYDINNAERLDDFEQVDTMKCDRNHGFSVDYFEAEFEPTIISINDWYEANH
jgi:hypothetical protein